MKTKILVSMLMAVTAMSITGCDSATSSNDSRNDATTGVTTSYAIKGKLAGTGFKNAQVCLNGTCVYADQTTGEYTIPSSATTARMTASAKASARATSATVGTAVGYAYIIVGNDTLKEIPVLNWNSIIPEKYIVQHNVGVTVPTRYTKGDVQFVYWDNDSIAHAVGVPKTSGLKHSAYVYTYYDSSSFTNHDTIFSWFARIKMHDSVKTGTAINKLTYDAGDVVIDSSDFSSAVFVTEYYKTIPSGDTLREYVSGTAATTYSNRKDSVLAYTLADTAAGSGKALIIGSDTNRTYWIVLGLSDSAIDSARITFTATGSAYSSYSSADTKYDSGTHTIVVLNQHTKTSPCDLSVCNVGDHVFMLSATSGKITDLKVYYFKN